jgi:methylated-DNA-[protein]-cysteine S-methyltransferase
MMSDQTIIIQSYPSPAGELIIGSYGGQLCLCDWAKESRRKIIDRRLSKALKAEIREGHSKVIDKTIAELDAYFAGKSSSFDIPVLFVGTDFQKSVWNALLDIPYGETISYGSLAQRLGHPKAVRAVANANGANAISIIVPCHRVIGSNHQLVGYGGGLEAKKILLDIEAKGLSRLR